MRWLAGLMALLVAGVVLAGCSGPEAEAGEPSPTEAPEKERLSRPGRGGDADEDDGEEEDDEEDSLENATLWTFAEEFDLTVTSASTLFDIGGLDDRGCVALRGAPFRVLGGNATVTWSAQTPAADQLSLKARQYGGDHDYQEWSGASPLEVEIPEMSEVEDDDSTLVFAVEAAPLASAAYEQAVHLSLSFEYEAHDEVLTRAGCF